MSGYSTPNYTQVPNELLDMDLCQMSNAELRVTLALVRKIVGFHKTAPEPVSYSQLERMTGLSRQGVTDGVKAAIKRGRIKRAGRGPRGISLFTVNFDDQSSEQTSTGLVSRPVLVKPVDSQKKQTKEKKQKDSIATPTAGDAQPQPDENKTPPSKDAPKPKPQREPKTLDNIKPVQAVVAFRAFGVKPGQVITATTMTRVNMVVKELRERFTNGSSVGADELKAAYIWYADARSLTPPRDPVKAATMIQEYRDAHGGGKKPPTLSDPDPTCPVCHGVGWYTTATENGNDMHVCDCRTPVGEVMHV